MAVNTEDLDTVYENFLTKSLKALKDLQDSTQMEDEYFSTTVSTTIVGAMSNSIQALDVFSQVEVRNAQSAKDLLVKDKEIAMKTQQIAESVARVLNENSKVAKELLVQDKDILVKTQQIAESVARVLNENSKVAKELLVQDKDILVKTQQIAESVARVLNENSKTTATVALTDRQAVALDDAKHVKKAEILGNTASLIESGGAVAPTTVWTAYATAIADI